MLKIAESENIQRGSKRKNKSVNFRDEEEIINLEDIDDTVGKFRNLVQSTIVIPNKRIKTDHSFASTSALSNSSNKHLFDQRIQNSLLSESLSSKLNFDLPNLNSAPEVNFNFNESIEKSFSFASTPLDQQKFKLGEKKKYIKEKWPGRDKPHFQN